MNRGILHVFVLAVLIGTFSSCKKNDDPFTPPEPYFVSFEIDGTEIRYEDGENNYGNGPGIDSYLDSAGTLHSQFTTYIRSSFDPDYENDILTLQMVKFFTDTNPISYNTSFLMFDEGTYDYGSWNEDSTYLGVAGAVITYTDSDGKIWSSDQLFGTQENWSDFEITLHKAVDETQFGAETEGVFDCRVFDGMGGHVDLRNGRFHARTIFQE